MAVSINDVAEEAGVSTASVSRVFNKRAHVRDSVRLKVIKAAEKLDYNPRHSARRDSIALLIGDYAMLGAGGYYNMLLGAFARECAIRDFRIETLTPNDLPLLSSKLVTGVVSTLFQDHDAELFSRFKRVPFVCVNHHIPGYPLVASNETQGMHLAVDHLYNTGHRNIALLIPEFESWCNVERHKGYEKACEIYGLSPIIQKRRPHPEPALEACAKLIRQDPDAIIATSEDAGTKVAYALSILGKKIPEDISLITHEYTSISEFLVPAQTTIRQDFDLIASRALDCIERKEKISDTELIDYTLIQRDSVGGSERK